MKALWNLLRDGLVATGAAIVVFSIGLVVLILVTAVPTQNPYVGLFTVIFLPVLVIIGALIFIFGVLLHRPDKRRIVIQIGFRKWLLGYLTPDFRRPRIRRRLLFFFVAGMVEIVVFSTAGYKTAQFMDTPQFCASCHAVMDPEYTVYQNSPHARVACVSCHIGPGTPWLVRSKITGMRQVWHVMTGKYPRPIETPVKSLRPARETCEQCHWPQKFSGNLSRSLKRYNADESNTERKSTIVLKIGGGGAARAEGIHWHVSAKLWYLSEDEKRQQIVWVGVQKDDNRLEEYTDPAMTAQTTPERLDREKRLMDCIDCHNRATHIFRSPSELIDEAFERRTMDTSLPFLKQQGLKALLPINLSQDIAMSKVEAIEEFYKRQYPEIYDKKKDALSKSIEQLKEIVRLVTFPDMKVTWETHPDNLGHIRSPGCFRCHGKLVSQESGKLMDTSCTLCHDFAP